MTRLVPACRIVGDGPLTLVLLHGIGGNRHVWPAQFETFVAAGYRVAAWDMPGYGESAMPAEATMAALADRLRTLLDALGPSRFVLVGHSMGGMVAQELMARGAPFTRDIAALILCGTSPAFGKPDGDFQREFVRQRTAPLDAGKTLREMAEAIVPGMLGNPSATAHASAHTLAVDAMGALTPAAYRAALQALVGFEQRAALARLAVPVLLIAGEHDTNAPAKVMARMADAIPAARYVCLPGAGHLMNLTHPAEFNAEVRAFLESL
ncbi:alpha/beta hydrolase [Pandoraea cepalis]|uniref:Alpha/beta hydrolase n=1 Tax=Pandoraea cepalis TaxID=2508294 RepID=A0AAW7MJW7_9BURK|nr:alpha/beta hydrolase [Pandoraea cepalis]MDN4572961.1 alpha/beta hydrolase [Pandoraea cepalis]MDN4577766.1 alpha/beta hydrolase [Pandoraea cepalis]